LLPGGYVLDWGGDDMHSMPARHIGSSRLVDMHRRPDDDHDAAERSVYAERPVPEWRNLPRDADRHVSLHLPAGPSPGRTARSAVRHDDVVVDDHLDDQHHVDDEHDLDHQQHVNDHEYFIDDEYVDEH